jgi:uncharacterized protein (DUF58 family)
MMDALGLPASARDRRIATLVVAPLVAATGALSHGRVHLMASVAPALIVLWMVMAAALIVRVAIEARRPDRRSRVDPGALLDHVDVLTATGSAVMWTSAGALVGAAVTGWASLSVIGVLGLGAVYLAATWTALVAAGDAPWRRATITRAILPEACTEGDPLREELHLINVWIPAGMRMFASGRATPHGLVTRYAVGAEGSRAELRLESALGAARRGEHHAPPLTLWLRDVLGLTRTPVIQRGAARFSVLPRPVTVTNVRALLGPGGDDAISLPAQRQPTEGTFRIREYAPGDDTRRIHWVRSLQTQQLVVRLPDEIPPADPVVRLILDNELRGTEALACNAPNELLDALVRVWLGVARALSETGTRVVLVTAADRGGAIAAVERPMVERAPRECLRLGARVRWQGELALSSLLARQPVRQIVVSSRPRPIDPTGASPRPAGGAVGVPTPLGPPSPISWIVLPEVAWTQPEIDLPAPHKIRLPFPSGSADNRHGRRKRERLRVESIWQDRAVFSQILCWTDWAAFSGHHLARPGKSSVELAVIP